MIANSPQPIPEASATLVELLHRRALAQPDQLAYTFLVDGDMGGVSITYRQLDRQARAIGAQLQKANAPGERALLLYPPGLDYIAAFFGCLYAGVAAVPLYPPRLNRSDQRLEVIIADAQPAVALTVAPLRAGLERRTAHSPRLSSLRWIITDDLSGDPAEDWRHPAVEGETLAFLQYTSGSTTAPRGVMVSHGNLLHNSALIRQCFELTPASRAVIWLPPYHDMGLIGGILQPLYTGFPATLLAPMAFLQDPFLWLKAISHFRATTSGGPNFAYDLCIAKITEEQRATLDLSQWSIAFNGSEPIHPGTLERFARTFASCGFRPEAFYPCYGLAEATLIVSGGRKAAPPVIRFFEGAALENNRSVEAPPQAVSRRALVGCGRVLPGQNIVVVDPVSLTRRPPDEIGEIWVSGPSVAAGYWNRLEETNQAFRAVLADSGEGPFLRTGDLGFLKAGELFIAGRLKDLIVIRGRNYYPQDIERTVEQSHPAVRPNCGAAFSLDPAGGSPGWEPKTGERVVIVQEVKRHYRKIDIDEVVRAVRQAVAGEHGLPVYAVALIRPGTIPKTSSGKIQRQLCRSRFLAGSLEVIEGGLPHTARGAADEASAFELTPAVLQKKAPQEQLTLLVSYLQAQAARALSLDPSQVDPQRPLNALGLDSLAAVELQHRLENSLGIHLPMASFLKALTLERLAAQALAQLEVPPIPIEAAPAPDAVPGSEHALSYGQRALWFLHQLAPDSAAYNIASAVRIRGSWDVSALRRACEKVVERHAALRTTFKASPSGPVQVIHRHPQISFEVEEIAGWSETALQAHLAGLAHQPFDLERGPLLRVHVLTRAPNEHNLLLVVHHIVTDFWSLAVLVREIGLLYQAEISERPTDLPSLPVEYTDYVRWQTEYLSGPEAGRLWTYWRQQLAGELPVLDLPVDHRRPPNQTYRGLAHFLKLDAQRTQQLKKLGAAQGATLYMTLLAAFQVLLYRYTGQEDILVGSPTAGRDRPQLAGLVGYFINPLVLRARLSGNPTFEEFLAQVRQTVLDAFEHQAYPFALLAEHLQPIRDPSRPPIFQAMFILQKSPLLNGADLGPLALGEQGMRMDLAGLPLESLALPQRTAQFDLTLVAAEMQGGLGLSFQYNADLFDAQTLARMAEHFRTLLEGLLANPQQRVGMLPLLTEPEQHQLLTKWNDTGLDWARDQCLHFLFEAQVARTPQAPAVIFRAEQLSYGELNARANQLAHYLQRLGVGPEVRVAICLERSLEMIVGLLGILKAGGAYVPLDPAYPGERLAFMLEDSQAPVLLSLERLVQRCPAAQARRVCLDTDWPAIARESTEDPSHEVTAAHLAYVMYTSGSTGTPKGVMIRHDSVVNCFNGMDQRLGCDGTDTLLAITSISFDISVLELFWTLTRGARVVLLAEEAVAIGRPQSESSQKPLQFSLFYFASDDVGTDADKYRLLLEGTKFADRHGFAAVWTPERHFHAFGGLYPNPSVISAALAGVTERIQIRAGSVVLPLHNPIRVAEEWSVVDNLSRGRVGLAFASGWHADDFVFFPENYPDRKAAMFRAIETVKKLWRGETLAARGGAGNEIEVRIFPRPIQPELPIWITAAGDPQTFIRAGEIGANVLTHLLGQTVEDVANRIQLYRDARSRQGLDPNAGHVTLMLHTFIGEDAGRVRETVRAPFAAYLRSSVSLIENLIRSLNLPLDLKAMSASDMDDLIDFAFTRYYETGALFGTATTVRPMIERVKAIGVDEIACLIDFGPEVDSVLESLPHLNTLKELSSGGLASAVDSLPAQAAGHGVSLMQCTPSLMQLLSLQADTLPALQSLRALLLGGEALPASLARQVQSALPCRIVNMYGPTEATIWSATHEFGAVEDPVAIGRPIANTQIHVLDAHLQPVPVGVTGELYIGGDGLARGYLHRPELTAERFIPNPFSTVPGAHLYASGDLARYRADGSLEYLGRTDQQVKIRGYRIELEEIEAILSRHPEVKEAVVVAQASAPGEKRLVAYLTSQTRAPLDDDELRRFLKTKVPDYMVPAVFMLLESLPLTSNGKVDRRALPAPEANRPHLSSRYIAPQSELEQRIARVWQQALNVEKVGIHDNFFDLGGHSLLMAQVHAQLRALVGRDWPLIKFLEHPTISALAGYLAQEQPEPPSFQQSYERARKQRAGLERQRQHASAGLKSV